MSPFKLVLRGKVGGGFPPRTSLRSHSFSATVRELPDRLLNEIEWLHNEVPLRGLNFSGTVTHEEMSTL